MQGKFEHRFQTDHGGEGRENPIRDTKAAFRVRSVRLVLTSSCFRAASSVSASARARVFCPA